MNYEVLIGVKHMGFVSAISHRTALAKARAKFGPFCDVELALDRKARPSDRRSANGQQARKTARRYPTPGFDARRDALVAAFKAAE